MKAKYRNQTNYFATLTWDDLEEWAGSTISKRGQEYYHRKWVRDLATGPNGEIIAWVDGTERYATLVVEEGGDLVPDCTCPYDGTCKHAVAVVLTYIEMLKKGEAVPMVDDSDPRLVLLNDELDPEDWDDEEDLKGDDDFANYPIRRNGTTRRKEGISEITAYLEGQTHSQLVKLLNDLAAEFPEVRRNLNDRRNAADGKTDQLVTTIRKEITRLAQMPGWQNYWGHEGFTPDYSRVRKLLNELLRQGHTEILIELGKELLFAGNEQVAQSDDEGETAEEINACLEVVFEALITAPLPMADKMQWAVEAELDDEYELCGGLSEFWEQSFLKSDWDTLANRLYKKLEVFPAPKKDIREDYSWRYGRNHLSDWVIRALRESGRQQEALELCEREAKLVGEYERLIRLLMNRRKYSEAKTWIRKGIEADQGANHPQNLRNCMKEILRVEKDPAGVAALAAEEFFAVPSLSSYQTMQKAAEGTSFWTIIREFALHFLETGENPLMDKQKWEWPLPETGLPSVKTNRGLEFPMSGILIEIAIFEKCPDRVVYWLDKSKPDAAWRYEFGRSDAIAAAIAGEYPDRAIAIWKRCTKKQIDFVKPSAYEEATTYLRKIRKTLDGLGRKKEWQDYLLEIRNEHHKKRRLMEILDRLTDGPILRSGKK